jgi:hypothetical protein
LLHGRDGPKVCLVSGPAIFDAATISMVVLYVDCCLIIEVSLCNCSSWKTLVDDVGSRRLSFENSVLIYIGKSRTDPTLTKL